MSISTRIAGVKAMLRFDNRWQLIANRLLFNSTIDIYHYRGSKIIVDYAGGDTAGVRECLTSDMYRQLLPYMKLETPLSILDCGANGGGFPLLFHTEGYQLAKVVSVEMNPYTYSRLHYNLSNNLPGTVCCLNMIVAESIGEQNIRFGYGSTGDSLFNLNVTGKLCAVTSTTIDKLIRSNFEGGTIDVTKIDIEGAEYLVFSGDSCALLKQSRYLVIEIHSLMGRSPADVEQSIRQLGFKLLAHDADVYLFSNETMTC